MTQAPATPELVERLEGLLVAEDRMHPIGCATWIEEVCVTVEEAADALEAQQARIAELEGLFADVNALCTEINKRWEASQALADRYEKALAERERLLLDAHDALAEASDNLRGSDRQPAREAYDRARRSIYAIRSRQALSSQGRHEGVTSGSIPELPGVNAVPLPASPDGLLSDPHFVHLNMLRGGIAKLTPAQIGHLYRGSEAAEVLAEVMRQNPSVQPTDALYGLVNAARRHMATHPVFRTRRIGGEGSRARLEQEDQIASEDALRAALQAALSPSPDNTNPDGGR